MIKLTVLLSVHLQVPCRYKSPPELPRWVREKHQKKDTRNVQRYQFIHTTHDHQGASLVFAVTQTTGPVHLLCREKVAEVATLDPVEWTSDTFTHCGNKTHLFDGSSGFDRCYGHTGGGVLGSRKRVGSGHEKKRAIGPVSAALSGDDKCKGQVAQKGTILQIF